MSDDERLRLKKFLLRLHWVLNHPSAGGMATMAYVHGYEYKGPVLDQGEIRTMAGLPVELPKPEYPETEFCVERSPPRHNEYREMGRPVEANIAFRGTAEACHAWIKKERADKRYDVNTTGRMLRTEEECERAFCALYCVEI